MLLPSIIHVHLYPVQVPYFTGADIASVETQCKEKEGFEGIDILMTAEWPKGVDTLAHPPVGIGGWLEEVLVIVSFPDSLFKQSHPQNHQTQSQYNFILRPRFHHLLGVFN